MYENVKNGYGEFDHSGTLRPAKFDRNGAFVCYSPFLKFLNTTI